MYVQVLKFIDSLGFLVRGKEVGEFGFDVVLCFSVIQPKNDENEKAEGNTRVNNDSLEVFVHVYKRLLGLLNELRNDRCKVYESVDRLGALRFSGFSLEMKRHTAKLHRISMSADKRFNLYHLRFSQYASTLNSACMVSSMTVHTKN